MMIHGIPCDESDRFWTRYGFTDDERYTQGQCHALALAILNLLGKPWRLGLIDWGGPHVVAWDPITNTIADIRGYRRVLREFIPLSFGRLADGVRSGGWERPILDEHTYAVAHHILNSPDPASLPLTKKG
jgi:hypothetical protein